MNGVRSEGLADPEHAVTPLDHRRRDQGASDDQNRERHKDDESHHHDPTIPVLKLWALPFHQKREGGPPVRVELTSSSRTLWVASSTTIAE